MGRTSSKPAETAAETAKPETETPSEAQASSTESAKPAKPAKAAKAEDDGPDSYPKTKYRKVPVSERWPNGYEAKRAENAADEQRMGKEWKDSPDDL